MSKRIPKSKVCTKCGKRKPLGSYCKNKGGKYGLYSRCNFCKNEVTRIWQKNNKEYCAKYIKENRERYTKHQRRWAKYNRERANEVSRNWKKRNPEKIQVLDHRRRSREKNAVSDGLWNADIRKQIYQAQEGLCYWSGKKISLGKSHIDHIVPLSRGGTDTISNKVLADAKMNSRKNAKLPDDFIEQLKKEGIVNQRRAAMDRKLKAVRKSVLCN